MTTVIQVERLGKRYRRGVRVDTGLRHVLERFARSPLRALLGARPEVFWALILFRWREPRVGTPLLAAALAFYILIACYPDWAGISSFGNRFFISLTPLFIVGLSVFLERVSELSRRPRAAFVFASVVLAMFVLWNTTFMFQWGAHLIPPRGPISWKVMIRNQLEVVPRQISARLSDYLFTGTT